ncbi:MAG: tetratricopeptide repeat protein [Armatimonadetes bacterium]|nr:tetratricopeptide repeat protein [Armatimonadota bacterium]
MSEDARSTDDLQEEEYARLCHEAGLHLRLNRIVLAEKVVAELLQRWPDRTTAQERAGDLAMAQGKLQQAREHYRQALELEPANADAERKYGLALLTLTPDERRRNLIEAVIADSTAVQPTSRRPLNAFMHALIFPGLGQLYNRQHEKGLALVAVGGLLLMLVFYLLVQVPYTMVAEASAGRRLAVHEQLAGMHQALAQMSGGYWLLAALLIVLYLGLYAFGIYDAYRQAQSQTERDLGVL